LLGLQQVLLSAHQRQATRLIVVVFQIVMTIGVPLF